MWVVLLAFTWLTILVVFLGEHPFKEDDK